MLKIVNYNQDEYDFPALVVLGCFDAIHVGHQELLKKAKLQAKINGLDLGVMMFAEGKGGRQVYTFEERLAMLEAYNTKFVLKIDYTEEFKKTTAQQFLATLEEKINLKGYMSGKDFRFGAGAKGKSSTLKNYADDEDNAVWYMSVKDVAVDGEKVSTTLIKKCIEEGKISKANALLGRQYFVSGQVCEGHGRGGKVLGFPTANIMYPANKVLVAPGVYGVEAEIEGKVYQGVANCGARPTFGEDAFVMEVHFAGLAEDLYGKIVTVKFINYIRGIKKFENAEELSAQIARDLTKIGAEDAPFEEPGAADTVVEQAPAQQPEVAAMPEAEQAAVAQAEAVAEGAEQAPVAEVTAGEIAVADAEVEKTMESGGEGFAEVVVDDIQTPAEELAVAAEEIEEAPAQAQTEEVVEQPATEEVVEEPVVEEVGEEPTTEETAEEQASEEVAEEQAEAVAEGAEQAPAEEVPAEEIAVADEEIAKAVEAEGKSSGGEPAEIEVVEDDIQTPAEELAMAAEELDLPEEREKEERRAATEEAAKEFAEAEQAAEAVAEAVSEIAEEEMNAAAEEQEAEEAAEPAEDELSLEEVGKLSDSGDKTERLVEEVFEGEVHAAEPATAEPAEEEVAAEEISVEEQAAEGVAEESVEAEDSVEESAEPAEKSGKNKKRRKGRGKSDRRKGDNRKK